MQIKKIASFDVKNGASTVRYADLDDGISFFPTDGIINIKSNKVRIAGFGVDANSLYRIDSSGAMYPLGNSNSVFLSNEGLLSSASIGGSKGTLSWAMAISDKFGVTVDGTLYAMGGHFAGTIEAKSGKIGTTLINEDGSIVSANGGFRLDANGDLTISHVGGSQLVQDAQTALSTANTAVSNAKTAQDTANDAKNKAENAQSRATTLEQWRTNTVDGRLNHAYNIVNHWAQDASNDSTTFNGGLIQTNTITADKIAIGDFTNYCQLSPNNLYGSVYSSNESFGGTTYAGYIFNSFGRDNVVSGQFPCKIGDTFRVSYKLKCNITANKSDGSNAPNVLPQLSIYTQKADKSSNSNWYIPRSKSVAYNAYGELEVSEVITLDTATDCYFKVFIQIEASKDFSGWFTIIDPVVRRMSTGDLIVDGAITTNKLASKSVNASILADDSVDGRILADNAISNSNFKDENYGTSSSWINLKSGKMNLGGKLTWDGTTLTVNGNGSFSGNISATSGEIGGWVITDHSLKSEGSDFLGWTHYISKISPDEFTMQYNDSGIGIGKSWSGNYYLRSAEGNTASYIYGESHNLRLRAYQLFSGDSIEKFNITSRETPKTPQYESYIETNYYGTSIQSYEHNNNSEGEGIYYGGYKNKSRVYINSKEISFSINGYYMIDITSGETTIRNANLDEVNKIYFKDGSILTNLIENSFSNYIEFTFVDAGGTDVLGVTCWKSDKNLKTNIVDTNVNATSILKDIRFKQFDWIKTGKHENIGVIAQDLEKIDKNLVIKLNNPNGGFTYQINPNEFATITAKSLQEQITRIDNMEININNKILQTKNDLLLENQKLKDKLSFLEEKVKYMNGENSSYSE